MLTEQLCRLGECTVTDKPCGNYNCVGSSCKTSCATAADCAAAAWCNGTACEPKKANGGSCSSDAECVSGTCATGSCCETSCASPASCATGRCLCGGTACAAGKACITWYLDADEDSFGATSGSDRPSCEDVPPARLNGHPFVTNKLDCYDNNRDAKPGATGFFPVSRGDGSYDYNCDGAEQKQYANITGLTCRDCGSPNGVGQCLACSAAANPGFCAVSGSCPGSAIVEGFNGNIACGTPASLQHCSAPNCAGTGTVSTISTVNQACR